MADSNLKFDSGEVKKTIDTIRTLTKQLDADAIELKEVAQKCVASGIQADFGREILQKLEHYYDADMTDNMKEMDNQAAKLEVALPEIEKFSQDVQV